MPDTVVNMCNYFTLSKNIEAIIALLCATGNKTKEGVVSGVNTGKGNNNCGRLNV